MSKQKKKKANTNAQQKVMLAQSKNEFKRRLYRICMMLPDGEAKCKLLEKHIEFIYNIRPRPIKTVLVSGKDTSDFVEYVKSEFDYAIKRETVPLYEDGPEVNLHDYQQLVRPLQMYIDIHNETHPGFADPFAMLLKDHTDRNVDVISKMARRAEMMGITGSDFLEWFYHVEFVIGDPYVLNSPRSTCTVEIKHESPSWKQIRSGTLKRSAARVGWCFPKKILWTEIKPSQLGIRKPVDNRPMEVYMLQHAANRLYERIGGKYRAVMNMDMFLSLSMPKAFPSGGGNFLIEYRISDFKVGYFAATITEGVLLIRTFLFLTHKGTPEGRKLTALTGLRKWDQMYLAFGNLLSLANSDIVSNEEAREIFREAGCDGLLQLCDKLRRKTSYWQISDQQSPIAEKMLQYIKSGKEEVSDLWTSLQDDESEPPEGESELPEGVLELPEDELEPPEDEPKPPEIMHERPNRPPDLLDMEQEMMQRGGNLYNAYNDYDL